MLRHSLSLFITAFWIAMVWSLIVTQIQPARLRAQNTLVEPEILALQWVDIDEWAWIREGERIYGAYMLTISRNNAENNADKGHVGYQLSQNIRFNVPSFVISVPVHVRLAIDLSPEFTVSRFKASLDAAPVLTLQAEGLILDRTLCYRLSGPAGEDIYGTHLLDAPLSLAAGVRPLIAYHFDLEVGQTYTLPVLDPLLGTSGGYATVTVAAEESILVADEEVPTFRLDTTLGGITRSSWVDENGAVIRRQVFKDIILERGERAAIYQRFPDIGNRLVIPHFDVPDFQRRALEAGPPRNAGSGNAENRLITNILNSL